MDLKHTLRSYELRKKRKGNKVERNKQKDSFSYFYRNKFHAIDYADMIYRSQDV